MGDQAENSPLPSGGRMRNSLLEKVPCLLSTGYKTPYKESTIPRGHVQNSLLSSVKRRSIRTDHGSLPRLQSLLLAAKANGTGRGPVTGRKRRSRHLRWKWKKSPPAWAPNMPCSTYCSTSMDRFSTTSARTPPYLDKGLIMPLRSGHILAGNGRRITSPKKM